MAKQNILVIKLGAFGDIIMTEGLMRCIRAGHRGAHITLLTEPFYAKFMKPAPHFDTIITDNRPPRWQLHKLYATRRHLKSYDFDLVYDLQNSKRSRLYCRWLAPAEISSTGNKQIKESTRLSPPTSIRDALAKQIAPHGADISNGMLPDLRWASAPPLSIKPVIEAAGLQNGFVLLVPGSSVRHGDRRWPYYNELAQMLAADGIACATAPGPDEMELCRALPATLLLDNGKPLSFPQIIALAQFVGYVVGNDTGPTHLMSCSNTKGLALFASRVTKPTDSGIQEFYDTLCVEDLKTLPPAQVFARVKAAYSNSV